MMESVSTLNDGAFVRRRTLKRAANLSSVNEELFLEHSVSRSPPASPTKRDYANNRANKPSGEMEKSDSPDVDEVLQPNGNDEGNKSGLAGRKRGEKLTASIKRRFKQFVRGSSGGTPPPLARSTSWSSPHGSQTTVVGSGSDSASNGRRMDGIAEEGHGDAAGGGEKQGRRGHAHSFSAQLSSATSARNESKPTIAHSHATTEEQTRRFSVPASLTLHHMPSFSEAAVTMTHRDASPSPALAPLTLDVDDSNQLRSFPDVQGSGEKVLPTEYASHQTTSPVQDTSFLLSTPQPPQASNGKRASDDEDNDHDQFYSPDDMTDQLFADAAVPPIFQRGLLLTKLSEKRTFDLPISLSNSSSSELNTFNIGKNISIGSGHLLGGRRLKRVVVRVDPDQGHIIYESGVDWVESNGGGDDSAPIIMGPAAKGARVIPIEAIREIRMGADAVACLVKPSAKDDGQEFSSPLTASFPFISAPQQPLTSAQSSSAGPTSSPLLHPASLPTAYPASASPSLHLPQPLPQTPPKTPSSLLPLPPSSPAHSAAASAVASRLLTIIYTLPHKTQSQYKTLHLLFPAELGPSLEPTNASASVSAAPLPTVQQANMCQLFCDTLRKLRAVRLELMNGLGNMAVREAMWERILWKEGDIGTRVGNGSSAADRPGLKDGKGAKGKPNDGRGDGRLEWGEVEALCRKLNVGLGKEELLALFSQADVSNSMYLTFSDFRKFLKLLKKRPEVKRLYKQVISATNEGKHLPDCPYAESEQSSTPTSATLKAHAHIRQRSVHHPHPVHVHHRKSSSHDYPSGRGALDEGHPLQRSLSASSTRNPDKRHLESLHRALSVTTTRGKRSSHDGGAGDVFDFCAFSYFMGDLQKSNLGDENLRILFERYLGVGHHKLGDQVAVVSESVSGPEGSDNRSQPSTMSLAAFTAFLLSPANAALVDQLPGYLRPAAVSASSTLFVNGDASKPSPHSAPEADRSTTRKDAQVYQDMTRPLAEYYISCSHNTYLIGHQLVGTSTTEGYIRALLGGCRSVEVDVFEGDPEPMIFHGKTFTSKVSFRAVCRSIAKYGFVASPYPVIISAELHLTTIEQQDMMATILVEEFGDNLIRMPVDGPPKLERLPSPEDLKGKVLLKTKHLDLANSREGKGGGDSDLDVSPSSLSASETDVFLSDTGISKMKKRRTSDVDKGLGAELQRARNTVLQRVRSRGKSSSAPTPPQIRTTPSSSSTATAPPISPSKPDNKPKHKMSFALAALLVYTVGVKCRGINKKEHYAVEHMFSLSENTINKMLKEVTYGYDDEDTAGGLPANGGVGKGGMMDLIKHCRTHLVRIYPKGLRVDSSNYEPHRYWSAGAQLVALNWQTCDVGFIINHAMFQRNGRCGYVLKPLALRSAAHKHLLSQRTNHYLDLVIISGQQLPPTKAGKSVVDPYVEVSLHVPDWTHQPFLPQSPLTGESAGADVLPAYSPPNGRTADMATRARRITCCTSVVKHNGFNPIWEERLRLPFDCVGDMRDLIFVKFTVRQEGKGGEDGEALAVYCASLGSLQQGYRHLPLHDVQLSQYLFATLFVRIDIQDVPSTVPHL